jgi:hypothetical protein
MYRRKSKGPKIDPCGTPCFIIPQKCINILLGNSVRKRLFLRRRGADVCLKEVHVTESSARGEFQKRREFLTT